MTLANIEVRKVVEQLNHRLLYSVRVNADTNHMQFPIGIQDQGSPAANEAAVLASTLAFATRENMAERCERANAIAHDFGCGRHSFF